MTDVDAHDPDLLATLQHQAEVLRRPLLPPPLRRIVGVLVVALLGGWLGLLAGGSHDAQVGPVDARFSVVPSLRGGTEVGVPPLGSLTLDSHRGPLHLQVDVLRVDDSEARELVADPRRIAGLGDRVTTDVREGVRGLVWRSAVASAAGASLLALLMWRRAGRTLAAAGTAFAVLASAGVVAAVTWEPRAITQPRFDGLLASAPSLVGSAQSLVTDFAKYEDQLAQIVTNVSQLYDTASNLPTFASSPDTVVALHVSDLHLNPAAWSIIDSISQQFQADLIIDTGDIVDWGSSTEDRYVASIASLEVPYVFVRGNHDSVATAAAIAAQPNAVVLDGEVAEVAGLRIAGVGDPRFTPDQRTRSADDQTVRPRAAGRELAQVIEEEGDVDLALLHDPTGAGPLDGRVALVLGGHGHARKRVDLPEGTVVLQQGSTGGAGLRGLEGEKPTPIEVSVVYFDRTSGALLAYDDITLGGLGLASAQIERTVIEATVAVVVEESGIEGTGPVVEGSQPSDTAPTGGPGASVPRSPPPVGGG